MGLGVVVDGGVGWDKGWKPVEKICRNVEEKVVEDTNVGVCEGMSGEFL